MFERFLVCALSHCWVKEIQNFSILCYFLDEKFEYLLIRKGTAADKHIKMVKICCFFQFQRADILSPCAHRVWQAAIAQCREAGARIQEVHLPHCEHAIHCYAVVVDVDVASNMAR